MIFNFPDTGEGLLPVIEVGDIFSTITEKRTLYQVIDIPKAGICTCLNLNSHKEKEIKSMTLLNKYAFVKKGSVCKY